MYICIMQARIISRCADMKRVCACAGDDAEPASAEVTSWPALPIELEEKILAKLSALELAQVSPTCKKFQAAFKQKMPEEQTARCDVAVSRFGRKRIACIAAIVDRFLKGDYVHPRLSLNEENACWILADRTLHVEDLWREGEEEDRSPSRGPRPCKGKDLEVQILYGRAGFGTLTLGIDFEGDYLMEIDLHPWDGVTITLVTDSDDDVLGLAMAQVLVTRDLGRVFQAHSIRTNVTVLVRYDSAPKCTPQGLPAVIGPLLALASRYKFNDATKDRGAVTKDLYSPQVVRGTAIAEFNLSVTRTR
jgi:hypothetical protein